METPEDDVVDGAIGDVQRMTDELLARARRRHPGVEFSIAIDQALSLLLPKTADRLYRTINGRLGYYAGHVYSDALVEATDHPPQHADLITVVPVDADVPMWQGDLRSGRISSARALNG